MLMLLCQFANLPVMRKPPMCWHLHSQDVGPALPAHQMGAGASESGEFGPPGFAWRLWGQWNNFWKCQIWFDCGPVHIPTFPTVTNFHASYIFQADSFAWKSFGNLVLSGWRLLYANFIILISFQCNQFWGKHPITHFQILHAYMLYTFTVLSYHLLLSKTILPQRIVQNSPQVGKKRESFAGLGTLWTCVCLDNFHQSEIKGGISTQRKKRSTHRSTTKIYSKLESLHGILRVSRIQSCPGSVIIETTLQGSAAQYSPFQGFLVSSLLPKKLCLCPYE